MDQTDPMKAAHLGRVWVSGLLLAISANSSLASDALPSGDLSKSPCTSTALWRDQPAWRDFKIGERNLHIPKAQAAALYPGPRPQALFYFHLLPDGNFAHADKADFATPGFHGLISLMIMDYEPDFEKENTKYKKVPMEDLWWQHKTQASSYGGYTLWPGWGGAPIDSYLSKKDKSVFFVCHPLDKFTVNPYCEILSYLPSGMRVNVSFSKNYLPVIDRIQSCLRDFVGDLVGE